MSEEEWKVKQEEVFVRVDGVHTKQQMERFIEEAMKIDMDLFSNVAYRFYLFPDYADNESRLFMLLNHALTDGVSYWAIMVALTDEKDFTSLPKSVSPPTVWT